MKQKLETLFLFSAFVVFLFLSFVSAGQLKVTEEHPFLINGSWILASDLKVGDELTTVDGKKVRITNITDVETKDPFPVYNLEAGIYHDFVVNGGDGVGVVVHNSDDWIEEIYKIELTRYPFNGLFRKNRIRIDLYNRLLKDEKYVNSITLHLIKKDPAAYLISKEEISSIESAFPLLVGDTSNVPFNRAEVFATTRLAQGAGFKFYKANQIVTDTGFVDFSSRAVVISSDLNAKTYLHELEHLITLNDFAISRGFGKLSSENMGNVLELWRVGIANPSKLDLVYRDATTGLLRYTRPEKSIQEFSMSRTAVTEYNSCAVEFSFASFKEGTYQYKTYSVSGMVDMLNRISSYTADGKLIVQPH